jgi:hypothetical protein
VKINLRKEIVKTGDGWNWHRNLPIVEEGVEFCG